MKFLLLYIEHMCYNMCRSLELAKSTLEMKVGEQR